MSPQSPPEALLREKHKMNPPSGAQISHMPFFPDTHNDEQAQHAMSHSNYSGSASQTADTSGKDRLLELDPNCRPYVDCSASSATFPTSRGKKKRLSSSSSSKRQYQCGVCGHLFERRSNLKDHMKKHDPNYKRPHSCVKCGGLFGRKTDLKRHRVSVSLIFDRDSFYEILMISD